MGHKVFEGINLFHITPCNGYGKMQNNRKSLTVVKTDYTHILIPSRELTFF